MTATTSIDWRARAAALRPREGLFIDGAFRPAASGNTFDKHSPVDGRLLARVAAGDAADIDLAVAAARELRRAGGGTPRGMLNLSWQQRVDALAIAPVGSGDAVSLWQELAPGKPTVVVNAVPHDPGSSRAAVPSSMKLSPITGTTMISQRSSGRSSA